MNDFDKDIITTEAVDTAPEVVTEENQDLVPVDVENEYQDYGYDSDPEEVEEPRDSTWKTVGKDLAISGVSAGIGYLVGRHAERKANAKRLGVETEDLKPKKEKKKGFFKKMFGGIKEKIHSMTAPDVVAEVEAVDVPSDSDEA